jgi:hypothetical protein
MLMSQRITKFSNFLKVQKGDTLMSATDLRMKIIQSNKIIVPTELMDPDKDYVEHYSHFFGGEDWKFNLLSGEKNELIRNMTTYAASPFKTVFLENEAGALLVEYGDPYGKVNHTVDDRPVIEAKHYTITNIRKDGNVLPMRCYIDNNHVTPEGVSTGAYVSVPMYDHTRSDSQETLNELMQLLCFSSVEISMIFFYLNCAKKNIKFYHPSKKEFKGIPAGLQGYYKYQILDLYRERDVYQALGEVEHIGMRREDTVARRAHLVRGHFKVINGKPHWWNSFFRNRQNATEVGVVDKDYRLN